MLSFLLALDPCGAAALRASPTMTQRECRIGVCCRIDVSGVRNHANAKLVRTEQSCTQENSFDMAKTLRITLKYSYNLRHKDGSGLDAIALHCNSRCKRAAHDRRKAFVAKSCIGKHRPCLNKFGHVLRAASMSLGSYLVACFRMYTVT